MTPIASSLKAAEEWASKQDELDDLRHFREQFHIPSQADLASQTLSSDDASQSSPPSIYLCGNSLGVQPKRTDAYVQACLTQWRKKGVMAHFTKLEDSPLPRLVDIDDYAARLMAPVVGAQIHEVAVMGTLTVNLHLMLSSFYRPGKPGEGKGRYKILLEGKAFPSDHYAIESQILLAGFDPKDAMILLEPQDSVSPLLATEQILSAIDAAADELALILLPGIQFYTGQYLDIKTITAHAHAHGILIGWDCAHAAGNIDLQLHDWDVDFAAWCTYKYLNGGPGSMAGIFVHDRHGRVEKADDRWTYRPRLTGWWGNDKSSRFQMNNDFVPRPGAAGFQISNPSSIDLSAVIPSLEIFNEAGIANLRRKSVLLTNFLEELLTRPEYAGENPPYTIITPSYSEARGAQLSIRLKSAILDQVLKGLEAGHVVIDERKPDVIRVAPAPLYNSFSDVFAFCSVFRKALAAI